MGVYTYSRKDVQLLKLHQVENGFAVHSWTLGLSARYSRSEPAIASKKIIEGASPTKLDRAMDFPECSKSPEVKPTHATTSGRNGQVKLYIDLLENPGEMRAGSEESERFSFTLDEEFFFNDGGTDGDFLSLLDSGNGAVEDELDAMAIDEVVGMLDDEEENQQHQQHQQPHPEYCAVTHAGSGISSKDAAAAVFHALQAMARATPVPAPPPLPMMPTVTASLLATPPPTSCFSDHACTSTHGGVRKETAPFCSLKKKQVARKSNSKKPKKEKSNKRWTDEETKCLKQGVEMFGLGQWLKIKRCFASALSDRTNVDLKDRWRNFGGDRQSQKRRRNSPTPPIKRARATPSMVCT